VIIGQIVRPRGVKGEVNVKPLTDFPPRFKQLETVFLELPQGEIRELKMTKASVRGNFVCLNFAGIDTREQAAALNGAYLKIRRAEVLPLAEGSFYQFELIGLEVKTSTGEKVGVVDEVLEFPANSVLVVKAEAKSFLIPVIRNVIKEVKKDAGEIIINVIDGLLD
jgi:16S rRNA processing protein RimM